jgi:hypothetical protein
VASSTGQTLNHTFGRRFAQVQVKRCFFSAPEGIRTPNLLIRRHVFDQRDLLAERDDE